MTSTKPHHRRVNYKHNTDDVYVSLKGIGMTIVTNGRIFGTTINNYTQSHFIKNFTKISQSEFDQVFNKALNPSKNVRNKTPSQSQESS